MDSNSAGFLEREILAPLTDAQRDAVTHVDGPLLILAGPGSGKTRVITHRIAYLLHEGIQAQNILALTFTNKAAEEMRLRLQRLAPDEPVWMGTFHSFCARMLRQYASHVGLKENFSIYDTKDSEKIFKQTIDECDMDLSYTSPDSILNEIHWAKNELLSPENYRPRSGDPTGSLVQRVYGDYQSRLLAANAVDFDDLLMHVGLLLRENNELRKRLDERYRYILVDEYQDTNLAQYVIARALSQDHPNLAVAGDPDQSIYGWRGANLSNILDFEHDYNHVQTVKLEQNYRSTPNILRVADHLISYNVHRKQKALFTDRPEGAPVQLITYPSARDEADDIAAQIELAAQSGRRKLRDFAIFYRVNSLSRQLEYALQAHGLPYQVVKGLEFYQRKEIKDVLAYLHLVNNPANQVAFLRIINTPPRKLGKKTLERLGEHARRHRISLLDASRETDLIEALSKPARAALKKFVVMYDALRERATDSLFNIMRDVVDATGYYDWLSNSGKEEDRERRENIDELLSAAKEFDQHNGHLGGLEEFLEQVALVNDIDQWDDENDRVTLMTMHAAKGLEFPAVFIVAVEHGILPHERYGDDPNEEEEERRLLFVGITRAEDELQLSLAQYRPYRGQLKPVIPSPFLMELPRDEMTVSEPISSASFAGNDGSVEGDWQDDFAHEDPASVDFLTTAEEMLETQAGQARRYPPQFFQKGIVVEHPEYGAGKIIHVSGNDEKRTVRVRFFDDLEIHTFRVAYSPLMPAEPLD